MKYLFMIVYLIILIGCVFYGIKDEEIMGCLLGFAMILGILPFFINRIR